MQITITAKLHERLAGISALMAPGLGYTPSIAEVIERLTRCYEVQHEVLAPQLYKKRKR